MTNLRVLVTNASRRKAISIIRALGKAGMEVICADSDRWAAGFFSKYCQGRFVYPSPKSDTFMDSLINFLSEKPCDVIFPLDDDALEVISKNRDLLPNPNALLLPSRDTVELASDKSRLIPYANEIGIEAPKTVVINNPDDIANLSEINLPVVIKPAKGSGSRGVVYVDNQKELLWHCRSAVEDGKCLLVQERLPAEGEGLGYFALYDRDHNLVAQFMHRRLREYPLSGGPSTLREGIWDEKLAQQSRNLLESLNWVGLAMVEYKLDTRDGKAKLMEINGRFWGSIALPIFSGVNFPVLTANITAGKPVEPKLDYQTGQRARWLWPGDLLHCASSLRKGSWPRGFLKLIDSNTCFDLLSARDPIPAAVLTFNNLLSLCSKNGRQHLIKRSA